MTITNYLYCEDEIIGEIVDDVSYDYLTDSLGSVTHLIDQAGVVVKNTRYKPFGEVLSNAGSARDPFYRWVGNRGYRATTLATATHYVRARSYDQRTGSWTSVDKLWPNESAISYVQGSPILNIDPLGSQTRPLPPSRPTPTPIFAPSPPPGPISCSPAWNNFVFQYCQWCSGQVVKGLCQSMCDMYSSSYYGACDKPKRNPKPGEHWGPMPTPGGPGIAPSPPPLPPISGPCFRSAPDCGPTEKSCVELMTPPGAGTGGWIGLPNVAACITCCNNIPRNPDCDYKAKSCYKACDEMSFFWYDKWFRQIEILPRELL